MRSLNAAFFALLLCHSARAADGDECKLSPPSPDLVHEIDTTPSYFAKVSADGRYMFFIGSGNYILDLEHDGTVVKVPGPYDPVPMPPVPGEKETRYFTVPSPNMQFFDFNEVKSKMVPGQSTDLTSIQPVFRDPQSRSSYQSAGVLGKDSSGHPIYRVANGNLVLSDYQAGDTPEDWKKLQRSGGGCRGSSGQGLQLPMLSKDGKMASAYDPGTGTTKLYSLTDDGSCTEAADLGFASGKVEFNYQNDKITFHVDSYSSQLNGQMFSGVSANMTKNVYTMDIKHEGSSITAGNIQRITSNSKPGEGAYYPSFTANGKVVYVQGTRNLATNRVAYSFNRVDPGRGGQAAISPTVFTGECPALTASYFALGDLMKNVCKSLAGDGLASTDAALWTLSLDPKACQQLVKKHWGELSEKVKGNEQLLRSNKFQQQDLSNVTEESVAMVCPSSNPAKANDWHPDMHNSFLGNNAPETDPHQVFDHRCLSCHDGGRAAKFDWDHLSLNQVNRMLIAVQEGSMPQGNFENRATMLQPLAQRLLELQSSMEEGEADAVDE
jgi:hypothetical protein